MKSTHKPKYSVGTCLHNDDFSTPLTLRVLDVDLDKERYTLKYIGVPDKYRQFLGKVQSEDMTYFESTEWTIVFIQYNSIWNSLNT